MSLLSLVVVGLCSLLRVGRGPCLSKRPTARECTAQHDMSFGGAGREYQQLSLDVLSADSICKVVMLSRI